MTTVNCKRRLCTISPKSPSTERIFFIYLFSFFESLALMVLLL